MAANTDPIFLLSTLNPAVLINTASGTALQTIMTAGSEGGALTELIATSTDTSAIIVEMHINNGTTSFKIGEVIVAAGSGTDGSTAAVNLLNSTSIPIVDADGAIILQGTYIFQVNAKVAITAATALHITGVGGNY